MKPKAPPPAAPAAPSPQRYAPGAMLDPRESIHFVAATELVIHGRLTPETVELLILLSPQPMVQYVPPENNGEFGTLTVGIGASGAAFSKNVPIAAAADAISGGQVQAKAEDEITMEIAEAIRVRLRQQINQRNRAVSDHMKAKEAKDGRRRAKLN